MKATTVGPLKVKGCWEYRIEAESCLQVAAGERGYEDLNPTGPENKHILDWVLPSLNLEVFVRIPRRRIFCGWSPSKLLNRGRTLGGNRAEACYSGKSSRFKVSHSGWCPHLINLSFLHLIFFLNGAWAVVSNKRMFVKDCVL